MPGTEIIVSNPLNNTHYASLDLVPASLHLDDSEIELAASQTGNAIQSEWIKRTLLANWLERTKLDKQYDYVIVDCPPATKIVSQNAIALSHGYIVPVVPEAVMERGAPHLVDLIRTGIDERLHALSKFGEKRTLYVRNTRLAGIVITRIKTAPNAYSGFTNDHTEHLHALQQKWGGDLLKPYIRDGTGIPESLTASVPVYDREFSPWGELTQNVGKRGFAKQFRELVAAIKDRVDAL